MNMSPIVSFFAGGTLFTLFIQFINSKFMTTAPVHIRQIFEPFFLGIYLSFSKYKNKMSHHVRNYCIVYVIYALVPLLFLLLFPTIACVWKTGIIVVLLWSLMIYFYVKFGKIKQNSI